MRTSPVVLMPVSDAERRREEIISSVGDVVRFRARGQSHDLDLDQRMLFEELCDLEFLLEVG